MTLPQCSHITRKRGVYYYRRRLPVPDRKEVAVSLFTRHYRPAEYRAARLNVLFARIVPYLQDRTKIAAILRRYLQERIAEDEAEWLRVPTGEPGYAIWADDNEDPITARGDARRRDFAGVEEAVDDIIRRHGLTEKDRPEIAFGLVQARIKMLEARLGPVARHRRRRVLESAHRS